jgi:transcriptional regulator with XRE-family HTH domain
MADRIKKRRESYGLTQEMFCERIELSISSYTKIENAFQRPAMDTLIRIAKQLDLSLDYIVFGTEERKPIDISEIESLGFLLKGTDSETLQRASVFLAKAAKLSKNKP